MTNQTQSRSKTAVSGALFTLIAVLVVAGVGLVLHSASGDSNGRVIAKSVGTIDTPKGTMNHAVIELGVYPDSLNSGAHGNDGGSHPGYVSYGPSNHIVLPANSLITMTIKGYDSGEQLNNAYFGKVIGTVDGTVEVDGKKYTQFGIEEVQHTWTLHGLPGKKQDPLFVNIPLMKLSEDQIAPYDETGKLQTPIVTTFSFYTGSKGEYVWNCEFPCGDGTYAKFGAAMSKYGYMSGKVSVV